MLLVSALSVAAMVRTRSGREPLFQAGLVQPYLPGMLKWDPDLADESVTRLERLSIFAQAQGAEVLFWPESALPWPVVGSRPDIETWCGDLSAAAEGADRHGGMAEVPAESGPTEFFNGVLVVDPRDEARAGLLRQAQARPLRRVQPARLPDGPIS
jgi:apolipoprotein N-acyltransferase